MGPRAKVIAVAILAALSGATGIGATLYFLSQGTAPAPIDEYPSDCPVRPESPAGRTSSTPPIEPLPLTTVAEEISGRLEGPEGAFSIGDEATWEAVWCEAYPPTRHRL